MVEFVKCAVLPTLALRRIYAGHDIKNQHKVGNNISIVLYTLFHFAWIALFAASGAMNYGFLAFGFTAFFINACILTCLRQAVREQYSIRGNIIGDFFAGSFMYPQALTQMLLQYETNPPQTSEEVNV